MDSVVPSHLQTLTAMGTESGPVTRLFPVHPALGPRLSETLSTGCGLGWEATDVRDQEAERWSGEE